MQESTHDDLIGRATFSTDFAQKLRGITDDFAQVLEETKDLPTVIKLEAKKAVRAARRTHTHLHRVESMIERLADNPTLAETADAHTSQKVQA